MAAKEGRRRGSEGPASGGPGVVVTPGVARSAAVRDVPAAPPGPGDLVVDVVRVGVCGTDRDSDAGTYGTPPPGRTTLFAGHESLLRVRAAGPRAGGWRPGQWAVGMVREPGPERCGPCRAGGWDFCPTGHFRERGIRARDGFLRQRAVLPASAAVRVPDGLEPVEPLSVVEKAVERAFAHRRVHPGTPRQALVLGAGPVELLAALLRGARGLAVTVVDQVRPAAAKGPAAVAFGAAYRDDRADPLEAARPRGGYDLVLEATGYAPLLFRAAGVLAPGGGLIPTGVSRGAHRIAVDADALDGAWVRDNRVVAGSVNAARRHYVAAVRGLAAPSARYGPALRRLVTRRVPLARFREARDLRPDGIKTVVEVGA